jgi:ABC-type antimicrobial peptide transport system permease subunit
MTIWSYVGRTLWHYRRVNGAVALSVAAATAVLTGALLVGDSVRESLRQLTLDRLGRIDQVLVADRFFRQQLADELSQTPAYRQHFAPAVPVILFPHVTLERPQSGSTARASEVLVAGCTPSFWQLGDPAARPRTLPAEGQIVLNEPLAAELQVAIGGEVILRLPKSNQVPADSPLANKSDRIRNVAGLKIVDIVPARSLGQFSLRPSQTGPRNAYVALETIQSALDVPGRVNTLLVAADAQRSAAASETAQNALRPTFEDYGLHLKRVVRAFPDNNAQQARVIYDYFSLTTDRMVFSRETESAQQQVLTSWNGQGVFTYLVNSMAKIPVQGAPASEVRIPYSMVTAIDPSDGFPLQDLSGERIRSLEQDEIVLTQWAARDLAADVGDRLQLEFFAPETTHGQAVEHRAEFRVKAIAPLTEPAQPYRRNRAAQFQVAPALANDPDLTPAVKGVTDQETIDDWDAPFPFDYKRVRKVDEDYWANHRTTPKAFLSLAAGRALWNSRFGHSTSFRIPATTNLTEEIIKQRIAAALSADPEAGGLAFIPLKQQQLRASQGTTPFDALFLALSFFIIAAALLLVALLFRLGVDQRATTLGTLSAIGFRRRRMAGLLLLEGGAVAAIGGLVGLAIGAGYAQLMLYGLRTWWLGAITSPFVQFHVSPRSLGVGYVAGVLICLLAIGWTVYAVRGVAVRRLLSGQMSDSVFGDRSGRWGRLAAGALFAVALALVFSATFLAGMAQAGAFVGGGAALLASTLVWLWSQLRRIGTAARDARRFHLTGLAWTNAARNPLRSAITVGLIATAVFLIVATSSFRLAPTDTGCGGFDLVGATSEPVFVDLNDPAARQELLADQAGALQGSTVFSLRLRSGDDASCNNLYQASQPRVLGVTPAFIAHFDQPETPFAWSATAARQSAKRSNPWRLLQPADKSAIDHAAIPAIVDMNTAFYSLKPPVTVGSVYEADYGSQRLRFRIVGLLENSLLQGAIIISAADFERVFPDVNGYRYFLVQSAPGQSASAAKALEDRLGDEGMDVVSAPEMLSQLLAVQNAYLSTFQSLGALGLLLGTFGVAAVQLRNVVERRKELALLQATGFNRRRLAVLVLGENVALLGCGLMVGVATALVAVLPHRVFGQAAIPSYLLRDLGLMLVTVFLVGMFASLMTVSLAVRAPLLSALREE